MSDLSPCAQCRRHIRTREARCPFCAVTTTPQWRSGLTIALAVTAGLSTAACYGGPPRGASPRFEPSTSSTDSAAPLKPDGG